jgi:hypothetical protein
MFDCVDALTLGARDHIASASPAGPTDAQTSTSHSRAGSNSATCRTGSTGSAMT